MEQQFVPGTVHPEEDYKELERLSTKLGIPVPMGFIKVEATNPDGSPGDRYEGRMRTWNRNFWNLLFGSTVSPLNGSAVFGAGYLAIKRTSATVDAYNFSSNPYFGKIVGPINNDTYGILVGTGTTAESFDSYALAAIVSQGATSGKLVYGEMTATVPSYDAGTKVWTQTQTRIFNNNSGGAIVIAETGLACQQSQYYLIERSLLGVTVSVANSGQLTVTYTMTMTFPA